MEELKNKPTKIVSKFKKAKNEVKELYENMKAKDDSIRISAVYSSYATDKGFRNWNSLAALLKQEDLSNGVCWNCHDFVPDNKKFKCPECGKGK